MKASEKYRKVFGEINHLSDKIPWTTGLSNMVEFLVWGTSNVLGVSKKEYARQIIDWSKSDEASGLSSYEVEKLVERKLNLALEETEQLDRLSNKSSGICSAREALRRVKFFSEDYLNKEFDIFLNLASDRYLDAFYSQYIDFNLNNSWSTHGNSGLFEYSTELTAMFMDNLAYNLKSNILIANELKLNGNKNRDQILKYSLMYNYLESNEFIEKNAKFLLLFIGGKEAHYSLEEEIVKEVEYCERNGRFDLVTDDILSRARNICLKSIVWTDVINFNEGYVKTLDINYQVERKLLKGFNSSLQEKSFMET